MPGIGDLWAGELIVHYDERPTCMVTIMEIEVGEFVRETQNRAHPLDARPSCAAWIEPST